MSIVGWLGAEDTCTFNIQWSNLVIKFDIEFNEIVPSVNLGSAAQQNTKVDNICVLSCMPLLSLWKERMEGIIIFYRFSACNYNLVSQDLFFLSFKYAPKISGKSLEYKVCSELFHLLYWFLRLLSLLFPLFFSIKLL